MRGRWSFLARLDTESADDAYERSIKQPISNGDARAEARATSKCEVLDSANFALRWYRRFAFKPTFRVECISISAEVTNV